MMAHVSEKFPTALPVRVDGNRLVYDCFMFFNELDILEVRLNVLDPVVDKFVLVESDVTLRGEKKEMTFEKNKERFAKFQNKIIHLVYTPDGCADAATKRPKWYVENLQRDMIMRGLEGCRADDVILISDVDEIPVPEKIAAYKNSPGIKVFQQRLMYYYANFACWTHPVWYGTRMGTYADLLDPKQDLQLQDYFSYSAKGLPTYFRFCQGVVLPDAGWHFSYCGGADAIRIKKKSIPDGYDHTGDLTEKELVGIIRKGQDIHGRDIFFRIVSLSSFPKYLRKNVDKYREIILLPTTSEKAIYLWYHIWNVALIYRKKIMRRLRQALSLVFSV